MVAIQVAPVFCNSILRAGGDLLVAGLAADRIDLADEIPGRGDVIEKHDDDEGDARDDRDVGPAMVDLIIHAGQPSRGSIAMLIAAAAKPTGHMNIGQVSPTRSVSDFQRK